MEFTAAIAECASAKCLIFEALGYERLARYFFTTSFSDCPKGEAYHEKATQLYKKWGAFKRADWLDDNL
jgi:hypothetical protein